MKMKKLSALVVLLVLVSIAGAEPGTQWERESSYNKLFDTSTIETIKGRISDISTYPLQNGRENGIQLTVDTKGESITVHLGPDWYIEHQEKQLEVGDKVTVKGSRVEYNGSPTVFALAVATNNQMLVLRSASGAPVWAGWQSTR
jgi:hypothetical protein